MLECGNDLVNEVCGSKTKRGGIDAGVSAEVLLGKNVLVDKKRYVAVKVVHKTENTAGAGGDVKKRLHILTRSKREP